NSQEPCELINGSCVGGCSFLHGPLLSTLLGICQRPRMGPFYVGSVAALWAVKDQIFPSFGQDHKLVGDVAADGPRICLHRTHFQATAGKDAFISMVTCPVTFVEASFVPVER